MGIGDISLPAESFFSQHIFDTHRLPLVVMLNKRDLFEARLKGKSEGKFHHYVKSCPRDVAKKGFKDVRNWLLREVLETDTFVTAPHGALSCFLSCATDVDQAKDLIDKVFDAVMLQNVDETGLA